MKTVYILGAGFSVEAGAPTQANIMSQAFGLYSGNKKIFNSDKFNLFLDFLSNQLNVSKENYSAVDLEDIFTPLDRCLNDSSQFRGVSLDKIMEVRKSVFYIVGETIRLVLNKTSFSKEYINGFAKYLTDKSSVRGGGNYRERDPVSVISSNWDILLDNSIHKYIDRSNCNAVVDYCCYISSLEEGDESIKPGLEKLGQGGFNVKLLKLHGSLNWLQCPRCIRLYINYFKKEGMRVFEKEISCRHCDTNFSEEKGNHLLSSNLIMPTYIKDLSNPQYKIIWQNAGIEISEANKLVFIGYSLPSADYELRQLLSRMTRKTAEIEVVTYSEDNNNTDIRNHWMKFFGDRKVKIYFDGAKSYIEKLIASGG